MFQTELEKRIIPWCTTIIRPKGRIWVNWWWSSNEEKIWSIFCFWIWSC